MKGQQQRPCGYADPASSIHTLSPHFGFTSLDSCFGDMPRAIPEGASAQEREIIEYLSETADPFFIPLLRDIVQARVGY